MVSVLALVFVLPATLSGITYEVVGENLVGNSGFEQHDESGFAAGWSGSRDAFSIDQNASRSGKASLKYSNSDADKYLLCSSPVDLEPDRRYEVSVWVKTQGVEGSDSGATVCVEWSGEDGGYLGGTYPSGVKGDSDWTQVKGLFGPVPPTARALRVTCYLRKGMTGTAWWDDVSIRRVRENPFETVLLDPNYRGWISDTAPEAIRVRAVVKLRDFDEQLSDVSVQWEIVPREGRGIVASGETGVLAAEETDIEIPCPQMELGTYTLSLSLVNTASNTVLSKTAHTLKRVAAIPEGATYIDRHNRLIVDGKPFFPLGMYWSGVEGNEDQLATYADSAFNCLMPYGSPKNRETLDALDELGLKVIYSVKDAYSGTQWCPSGITTEDDEFEYMRTRAEQFRDHPALLAWYINDELPLAMLDRLARHRDWIEELDPGHPSWVVLWQVDQVRDYLPSFDAIGTDPYPIGRSNAAQAAEWTRKTVNAVCGRRPVWQVPQAFNWAAYHKEEADTFRAPTYDELRSMVWQCITEGANGIIMYSWFDLHRDPANTFEDRWPEVKAVAAEVGYMIPVLLSIEQPPALEYERGEGVSILTKHLGASTYVVAVNGRDDANEAAIIWPKTPTAVIELSASRRITPIPERRLGLRLAPLEVRIFEIIGLAR